jgi:hypothetical protein
LLVLGDGLGATLSLEYTVEHADHSRVEFGFRYDRWKFGRSKRKAISNGGATIIITEPQSESNILSFSVGYVAGF